MPPLIKNILIVVFVLAAIVFAVISGGDWGMSAYISLACAVLAGLLVFTYSSLLK